MGMDPIEYILIVKNRIRVKCIKFFIRQIDKDNLFSPTPIGTTSY